MESTELTLAKKNYTRTPQTRKIVYNTMRYRRSDAVKQWESFRVNSVTSRCTPTSPNQCLNQVLTSYTLQFLKYSPDKILKVNVITARSKVKSRSHHDIAYLQPLTNYPTKYKLPIPYGF